MISIFLFSLVSSSTVHERQVLLDLLNQTSAPSVIESSFAQIAPLVIGGIAAAGAVGMVGGNLMPKLFTSHRDRRRSKDTAPPCESKDPLDTTDSDCFNTRWNLIVSYFPIHTKLQKWDEKLVTAENQVEEISSRITATLDRNMEKIFGLNGTPKKPSRADGAIAGSMLLTNSSSQLQAASIAAINAIQTRLINTTKFVIDDVRDLKTNIASAYGILMGSVKNASERLSKSTDRNTKRMTSDATKSLRISVTEVVGNQKRVKTAVVKGLSDAEDAGVLLTNSSEKVSAKLSDLDSAVDISRQTISDKQNIAAASASDSVGKAVDAVATVADTTSSVLESKFASISDQFRSQTNQSAYQANADWSSVKGVVQNRTMKLADATELNVTDLTVKKVESAAADSSVSLSSSLNSLRSLISNRSKEDDTIARDIRAEIGGFANKLTTGSTNTQSITNSVTSDIYSESAVVDSKKRILAKGSISVVNSQTQSVHEALVDAQSDSQQSLASIYGEQMGSVVGLFGDAGLSQFGTTKQFTELMRKIKSGSVDVDSNFAPVSFTGSRAMRDIQKTLIKLGNGLDETSGKISRINRDVFSSVSDGITDTSLSVGSVLRNISSDVSGTVSREKRAVLTDYAHQMDWLDKSDKTSHQTTELLRDGMSRTRELDSLISQLGNSDDLSFASLIDAVSKNDDTVASGLGKEMSRMKSDLAKSNTLSPYTRKLSVLSSEQDRNMEDLQVQFDRLGDRIDLSAKHNVDSVDSARTSGTRVEDSLSEFHKSHTRLVTDKESDLSSRLSKVAKEDDTVISSVKVDMMARSADTVDVMNDFVSKYSSNITSRFPQIRFDSMVSDSNIATRDLADLGNRVEQLAFDDRHEKMKTDIDRFLNSLTGSSQFMSDRFAMLNSTLASMSASSSDWLRNVSHTIASELLRIPSLITSGLASVVAKFSVAGDDLETRIEVAKEKLTTAQTEEERIAASDGLVVLERLKGVQEGVVAASKILRDKILTQNSNMISASVNMDNSMTAVLDAVKSLSSPIQTVPLNPVILANNQLLNGLNLLLNSTSGRIANIQADSALSALLALRASEQAIVQASATISNMIERDAEELENKHNQVGLHTNRSRSFLDHLGTTVLDIKKSVVHQIDTIMSHLSSVGSNITFGVSNRDDDMLTRIALAQMAVDQFRSLWNEYAEALDQKIRHFARRDVESIQFMEQQVKHELISAETEIQKSRTDITQMSEAVSASVSGLNEFEEKFGAKLDFGKDSLLTANRESNDGVNMIARDIHALSELAAAERQRTLSKVNEMLR